MSHNTRKQLSEYFGYVSEIQATVDALDIINSATPDPARTLLPTEPVSEPRRLSPILITLGAAAVVLIVVGVLPFLLGSGGTIAEVAQSPGVADPLPVGSFSWEVVEADSSSIVPVEWPWPAMGHTESGYHQWVSCEQFRGPNDPVGPSRIWSSPDGVSWTSQDVPCDDQMLPVADMLVLESHTQDKSFISIDGAEWSLLTPDGPSGNAIRGGPLWHGSENGYSPGALIWEIDDVGVLYDFSMPWDIGGYSPTGWLFEFENGLTAISRNTVSGYCWSGQFPDPMVKHSTDSHEWTDIAQPAFLSEGFNNSDCLSAFAHQDGTAVASLSDGEQTRLWRTTDGLEWLDVTPVSIGVGGVWAAGDVWVQGMAFFADATHGEHINISRDGLTWTPIDLPAIAAEFDGVVRVAGNKIFVFGDDTLIGTYQPAISQATER